MIKLVGQFSQHTLFVLFFGVFNMSRTTTQTRSANGRFAKSAAEKNQTGIGGMREDRLQPEDTDNQGNDLESADYETSSFDESDIKLMCPQGMDTQGPSPLLIEVLAVKGTVLRVNGLDPQSLLPVEYHVSMSESQRGDWYINAQAALDGVAYGDRFAVAYCFKNSEVWRWSSKSDKRPVGLQNIVDELGPRIRKGRAMIADLQAEQKELGMATPADLKDAKSPHNVLTAKLEQCEAALEKLTSIWAYKVAMYGQQLQDEGETRNYIDL